SRPLPPLPPSAASSAAIPRPGNAVSQSHSSSPAKSDLLDVLAGAGLENAQVSPELARNLGRILRVVVQGVTDVMEARRRIQDEFGLDRTKVQPKQNNPLKFSVNVDDALHNLL